mmetsp:Transcript_65022/g.188534  ORF Transcript_65022/g.188534 Transcript_65022/m.188534 type:complete len:301 (-) Transcript_65022:950-1852(-)
MAAFAQADEAVGVAPQDARRIQRADSEQDPSKEQQARKVNLMQRRQHSLRLIPVLRTAWGGCCVGVAGAVLQGRAVAVGALAGTAQCVGQQPHRPQGQKHAEVRRQASGDLQAWHHQDQDNAGTEDDHLLPGDPALRSQCACVAVVQRHLLEAALPLTPSDAAGALPVLFLIFRVGGRRRPVCRLVMPLILGCAVVAVARLPSQAQQRHEACQKRWQEELSHEHRRSNLGLNPQHGRRHIADGAPNTTRVRRHNDQATAQVAVFLVGLGDMAQYFQRHDRGGEVVDHRAQKEHKHANDRH